nr:ATP synthase F0 subunit 6 [Andricus mairei]UZI00100.1 ATP synthase F0 subunit 6 [Andricus mairei]UZN92491.1 ATP synthase F0 subunit 6 [Andricus mairei]UZN92517.1 ATP synthase F0 subunit 6 [Andricus mairei]
MMSNLFSVFDPSTSENFSFNWLSMMYFMLFLPSLFWFSPSKYLILLNQLSNFIIKEMKISLNKDLNFYNLLMFKSLFIFIMLNNFISLFPYIFNSTSHMVVSLSLSINLWISYMLFGWIKNSFHMFVHLTPQGTPYILMPFMVMIESVSNMIRPLTLAIRLTANIIAGHLLMTLISQSGNNLSLILVILMILIQSLLVVLEVAVSFIQAYVFSILSSLYSSETN